jgi:hypothetical protein
LPCLEVLAVPPPPLREVVDGVEDEDVEGYVGAAAAGVVEDVVEVETKFSIVIWRIGNCVAAASRRDGE